MDLQRMESSSEEMEDDAVVAWLEEARWLGPPDEPWLDRKWTPAEQEMVDAYLQRETEAYAFLARRDRERELETPEDKVRARRS